VKVQASPAVLHLCAGFLVSSRLVSFTALPRAEARTTPPPLRMRGCATLQRTQPL
jgi:hypothetical protein